MIYLRHPLKLIKILYWWNIKLKRNEFSNFLELDVNELINKSKTDPNTYNQELISKRELAHLLDDGHKISEILKNNYELIKKSGF